MTTFHESYCDEQKLTPYEGSQSGLQGGEYLGHSARPDLAKPGTFITSTEDGYYFDPLLVIEGDSYVWVGQASEYADDLPGRWENLGR